jgi:16S rRNA processing protein RimM
VNPTGAAGDWAVIGRLGHARGLRGELLGRANYKAERYGWVRRVALRLAGGTLAGDGRMFEVESIRDYKDGLIYKFREIGTRTEAEAVEQAEVLVPESERPALEAGSYYVSDLIGSLAIERSSGREIGEVAGWQDFGGPVLTLEVKPRSGDLILIPLTPAICVEIDAAAKRIVVDPPEGLLELNEESSQG